jgi:hypothetical protein
MCFGLRNNGSQMHQEKAQSLTLMGGEQMMRAVSPFIIVTCVTAAFFVVTQRTALSHVQISRTLNFIISSALLLPSRKFFCTSEHMPKSWGPEMHNHQGKKSALA